MLYEKTENVQYAYKEGNQLSQQFFTIINLTHKIKLYYDGITNIYNY